MEEEDFYKKGSGRLARQWTEDGRDAWNMSPPRTRDNPVAEALQKSKRVERHNFAEVLSDAREAVIQAFAGVEFKVDISISDTIIGLSLEIEDLEDPKNITTNFPPQVLKIKIFRATKVQGFPDLLHNRIVLEVIQSGIINRDHMVDTKEDFIEEMFGSHSLRYGYVVSWEKTKKRTLLKIVPLDSEAELDLIIQEIENGDRSNKRRDRR